MRIAFDDQIFLQQEHGGISRYIVNLAKNLATSLDVKIIAPVHFNAYLSELPAGLVFGKRVPRRRGVGRAGEMINRLAKPALMRSFSPDIVHETYYSDRALSMSHTRKVLTVYDMIHEKFPGDFAESDFTVIRKKSAIERADHICCISQSTRDDLIEFYPAAAKKSSVTLLGFDPLFATEHRSPSPGERPYLLFVGQRGAYKNFRGLLDAYASAPLLRATFDLVAVGGGRFTSVEIEVIGRYGLHGRVRQVVAGDEALQGWYAGASVFVYPSLYEGFGIPPLEAMAAGTPVVALDVSSVPEVCGNAAAYVRSGDPDELRDVIETVAFSRDVGDTLRAAGTSRIKDFSWRKCADETASIYRSVL